MHTTFRPAAAVSVRGSHTLSISKKSTAGADRRAALANALWRPVPVFAPLNAGDSPASWVSAHTAVYTGLRAPLPPSLHLLTAHALSATTLLLRISHSFESGEDAVLSQPATLDLATIFVPFTLSSCTDMTTSGNQPLAAVAKTTYTLDNGTAVVLPILPAPPSGTLLSVTLSPMQIRTFMCSM